MKRWIKIAAYVVGIFIVQELVMRWCFPLPELSNFDRSTYQSLDQGSAASFLRNRPWQWISSPDTNHAFVHEMNGYGFRDDEWSVEKPDDKTRVMFIGDSFVEGIMAEQSQTISAAFGRVAGPDVEVLNGGMLGVGMDSYLQLAADAVPIFKPDALVLVLFANDFATREVRIPSTRLNPHRYNKWKPRVLELVQQAGTGNSVPFSLGMTPQSFLPPVDTSAPDWPEKEAAITEHCAPDIARAMLDGTFNYYKVNQLLKEAQNLPNRVTFAEALAFLKKECDRQGTDLYVCYVPARHQVTNHYLQFDYAMCTKQCPPNLDFRQPKYHVQRDLLTRDCRDLGLPLLDFTEYVYHQEAAGRHLYWQYEDHMRGRGYIELGQQVAYAWQEAEAAKQ